jgi:hypothetical protein
MTLTNPLALCIFQQDQTLKGTSMNKMLCVCLFVVGTTAVAQISRPMVDEQMRSEMLASTRGSHSANDRARFAVTSGFTGFNIDNVARQGINIDIQALVSRISALRLELNAGIVLYNTSSSLAVAPVYSPSSSYFNNYHENQYPHPRFNLNFALGYIGTDVLYYFSDGKVRPYVAAGVRAVTWQMSEGFAGALTPSARAGIEISAGSSFSGFAEARYMYGMRNLLTPYPSSLKYVTTVAFGVSFAPQL